MAASMTNAVLLGPSSAALGASLASPSPRCDAPSRAVSGIRCRHEEPAKSTASFSLQRRSLLSLAVALPAVVAADALALLETDEDEELLEKVRSSKKSREAKIAKAGETKDETTVIQQAVNRLAKTGKLLDEERYEEAKTLLGSSEWVSSVEGVFKKVGGAEGKSKAASTFSSALEALQVSVGKADGQAAKSNFVTSAEALEKWIQLAGLGASIQGL